MTGRTEVGSCIERKVTLQIMYRLGGALCIDPPGLTVIERGFSSHFSAVRSIPARPFDFREYLSLMTPGLWRPKTLKGVKVAADVLRVSARFD